MQQASKKLVIIGAGIAGLCAAVYARKCGYDVELLEQAPVAGGLATSWQRGDYRFETCLHWLVGASPDSTMHARWREVCDIDSLQFYHAEEFVRLESAQGDVLSVFTDPGRMEAEMLKQAPQDADSIRDVVSAVRQLQHLQAPGPGHSRLHNVMTVLGLLRYIPLLWHWSRMSFAENGQRFKHPLLRVFFSGGYSGDMSALALLFSLSWMASRDAAYVLGGSRAVIQAISDNLHALDAQLRFNAQVEKILVQDNRAIGVQLANGETVLGDWVISAADGHATIYQLLEGHYSNKRINRLYRTLKSFPSYLQVSLGVAMDLSDQPGHLTQLLEEPLLIDPKTTVSEVSLRIFHFDPNFAPCGKTALTCFLPTWNYDYWLQLAEHDARRYEAEKQRIAEAVIALLEKRLPNIRPAIEVCDVSTPATVIHFTGNWHGSMEGWLLTLDSMLRPLPHTLPGLRQFRMIGQWVTPGGGLPGGLTSARDAVHAICREDGVPFMPERHLNS